MCVCVCVWISHSFTCLTSYVLLNVLFLTELRERSVRGILFVPLYRKNRRQGGQKHIKRYLGGGGACVQ